MTARSLLSPGVLVVLVLLAFGNSLQGSFHYDDFHSIVQNPHIRQLRNIPAFFVDPGRFSGDPDKAMYRPLLLVTYALNYAAGGYGVAGYHLVNLGLHLGCSLLVWRIAVATGAAPAAALAAGLLFGLHPLATEPVNYISSRSESLAAVLFLAAFAAHLSGFGRGGWVAAACFAMALFSKESAIVLPLLVLLYDAWVRKVRPCVRRHLPLWGVGVGYLLLVWANASLKSGLAKSPRNLLVQVSTQVTAWVHYLKLAAMPVRLSVEHQFLEAGSFWSAPVSAGVLLLVSAALWAWRGTGRPQIFWLAWWAICLMPASLVPLNVLVNEHRLYLPLAGLALLAAGALPARRQLAVPLAVAVAILGLLSFARNRVWRDELSLWQDAQARSPLMPRVHVHLGNAWRADGRLAQAQAEYAEALRLDPGHRAARTNLANLHYEAALRQPDSTLARDRYEAAAREYERVLAQDPRYKEALNNLGSTYLMLGRYPEAEQAFRKLIAAYPSFADGYYNLGHLAARQGRPDQARGLFRQALELQPDAATYFELGNLEAGRGDWAAAEAAYRQACARDQRQPRYLYNRAEALLAMGQQAHAEGQSEQATRLWQEARTCYQQVAGMAPEHGKVQLRLAQLRERLP